MTVGPKTEADLQNWSFPHVATTHVTLAGVGETPRPKQTKRLRSQQKLDGPSWRPWGGPDGRAGGGRRFKALAGYFVDADSLARLYRRSGYDRPKSVYKWPKSGM